MAGPKSVSELAEGLPVMTRSAVSQHLRVLMDAGLVYDPLPDGRRRVYAAAAAGLVVLTGYVDALLNPAPPTELP